MRVRSASSGSVPRDAEVHLSRRIAFEVPVALAYDESIDFVRDVRASLAHADFVDDVEVDDRGTVTASLVVNASMFGQRRLPFVSDLEDTAQGARLRGRALEQSIGWARVDGSAVVRPTPSASVLAYTFDVDIHLVLPEPERWGGRALLKMVEVTADRVLVRLQEVLPDAIATAAAGYAVPDTLVTDALVAASD